MNTSLPVQSVTQSASLTRVPSRKRRYAFASLLNIFNRAGLASVDLVDNFPSVAAQAEPADISPPEVGPVPSPGRPAHTRFMPWRFE